MGVINAENTLTFESSQMLFDKVKKRLSSYDALGLIDDGDFYDHVYFVLEELGLGVYKECEAVIPICGGAGQLPKNLRIHHVTYKLKGDHGNPPSINEQKPWIYYTDTEYSKNCLNKCCIECVGEESKTKVVVRTFVNGEDDCQTRRYSNLQPMVLSSNVRSKKFKLTDGHCDIFRSHNNEFTITDDRKIHVHFDTGELYMQYYGLPFDENELPMVPDQKDISAAIEYRIYSQLFEEFMWNSTVPGVQAFLQDARNQFEFHFQQARYWSKLPTFQRMIQSIRRQRNRNKFWYARSERTAVPRIHRR